MAFTETSWVDGTTPITAAELNRIEDGVKAAHALDTVVLAAFDGGTSVPAGNTDTIPEGWWYVFSDSADLKVEVQLDGSTYWSMYAGGSTCVLVASNGTNVRVRNGGGAAANYYLRAVSL